jgi:hypothetical protein
MLVNFCFQDYGHLVTVKKNRLVVSSYNACTVSTLYLYSVIRGPTRLQHQARNRL